MARKKALHPSAEPEEEQETSVEEESEEGEYHESESDMEENGKTTPIQPSKVNGKPGVQKQTTPPPPAVQSSQSEEEQESESEEEEGEESVCSPFPNASDFTVKPISLTKRSSDSQKDNENDLRSGKKVKTTEGEEKKGNGSAVAASGDFGRVWSKEDEIALLQGMIDYQNKNGADPYSDKDAFHEFIKSRLQADVSKDQLFEKISRLKKNYFTNVKKIIDADIQSRYPFLSRSFDVDGSSFLPADVISCLKKNLGLIDSVKAGEWEKKWKEIRLQEAKLFLKKIDLVTEQIQLALDAMKKG